MKIRPGPHLGLAAVLPNGKVKKIQNEVLRKLKYPVYQQRLQANSICIVCNYVFQDKTRGWADNVKAICHPFREKHLSIFPDNKQLHLFSESDFIDKLWVPCPGTYEKKYDFLCFTIGTEQGVKCKGYHVLPSIAKVANQLGLHGLLIDYYPSANINSVGGRHPPPGTIAHDLRKLSKRLRKNKIETWKGIQSQKVLSKTIKRSKFVIFPNTRDASPRMIPEVIIRGTPVLVNKHIYGGWKYVNDVNGAFFDGAKNRSEMDEDREHYENELREKMLYMMKTNFEPQKIEDDFYSRYGFWRSAKRLAGIINGLEGHEKYRYIFYTDFAPLLGQWHEFEK